ncbi:long-chain-fatty-acid--CoA ligase [Actinomycetospora sp. NBRC 106375]|uniref:AMP-binding protein n=1 Tax=Actinomycetospora sp. NBRC 106375 TaxID=3032207 RepID=UPI00249FE20A|nr:AMP-binding protein [Actinomycetospora sp. NBRC 106375]GLZ47812.1 long-chain-fatty-acid--CoA ligase [Actinomycetospora sp. NBRC 106375]
MTRDAWARHLGGPVPDTLRAELAAGTLPAVAAASAAARPDRVAVEVDGEALTHGRLDAAVAAAAGLLAERGVGPADTVVLAAPASVRFVVAYLAVQRLGAAVVPVDPVQPAAAVRSVVDAAGARFVLDDARLSALAAARPRRPVGTVERPGNGDVAVLAFTSGTTGAPKGVPITHANLLASARAAMLAWRWHDGDVLSHALPLFHQHGLGGLHMTLIAGTTARLGSRFDPAAPVHPDTTVFFGVPAMWHRLLERPPVLAGMARLRLAVSGSAPLPPPVADRVAEHLGQVPLERYGLTESGLDVSNPYDGPRVAGTVGFPLPGVELRLGDQDEIELRGPQVIDTYWGGVAPEAFRFDGWFRTGDLGRLDAEGRLTIVGRLKELIITGGHNVVPGEVEAVLAGQPGVAEVAVAGVPSARWGEEVTAFVVAGSPAPDPDALLAAARERLVPYKVPKSVRFLDALPRNAMGKIQRTVLGEAP